MNVIFGNYGNSTIALIQWAHLHSLKNTFVISVDTGWQAKGWNVRVLKAEKFAKTCGFQVLRLKSSPDFVGLMKDRGHFPSTKFQWCAGFLKGLPLLDWLDEHDPSLEASILLGKRRADSRANFDLEEMIESSEHYGDRRVWYPLYKHTDDMFHALLDQSGLEILTTRSLECDPCVNSYGNDLARLQDEDMIKTKTLEEKLNCHLFTLPIEQMRKQARKNKNISKREHMFDMGCGAPFACGE